MPVINVKRFVCNFCQFRTEEKAVVKATGKDAVCPSCGRTWLGEQRERKEYIGTRYQTQEENP